MHCKQSLDACIDNLLVHPCSKRRDLARRKRTNVLWDLIRELASRMSCSRVSRNCGLSRREPIRFQSVQPPPHTPPYRSRSRPIPTIIYWPADLQHDGGRALDEPSSRLHDSEIVLYVGLSHANAPCCCPTFRRSQWDFVVIGVKRACIHGDANIII